MKYILLNLFTLTIFLAACTNASKKNITSTTTVQQTHSVQSFSDTVTTGYLQSCFAGRRSQKTCCLPLVLPPYNGNEIYKQVLKAKDLIDNYKETVDLSKEKSQREFIHG